MRLRGCGQGDGVWRMAYHSRLISIVSSEQLPLFQPFPHWEGPLPFEDKAARTGATNSKASHERTEWNSILLYSLLTICGKEKMEDNSKVKIVEGEVNHLIDA